MSPHPCFSGFPSGKTALFRCRNQCQRNRKSRKTSFYCPLYLPCGFAPEEAFWRPGDPVRGIPPKSAAARSTGQTQIPSGRCPIGRGAAKALLHRQGFLPMSQHARRKAPLPPGIRDFCKPQSRFTASAPLPYNTVPAHATAPHTFLRQRQAAPHGSRAALPLPHGIQEPHRRNGRMPADD